MDVVSPAQEPPAKPTKPTDRQPGETKTKWRKRLKAMNLSNRVKQYDPVKRHADAQAARRLENRIIRRVCSAPWREAVLHRNEPYVHTFQCGCNVCRNIFGQRLDPTPARESRKGIDCDADGLADLEPDWSDIEHRVRSMLSYSPRLDPSEILDRICFEYPDFDMAVARTNLMARPAGTLMPADVGEHYRRLVDAAGD